MKKLFAVFMITAVAMCFVPFMAFADMETESAADDNGIVFTKDVEAAENGNAKITLEAYTTGKKVVSTAVKPADVVLVLDQSGSMDDTFSDDLTRQQAMKNAVKAFIDEIDENGGHYVSVVIFGTEAQTLTGFKEMNASGKEALASEIDGLPENPKGATNIAAAMTETKSLIDGRGNDHQKVVIVFTDGVPTKQQDFDTEVADSAISTAKNMKAAGTEIYTIGVFEGADPAQLHGEKWEYTVFDDVPCDGEVGSFWGGSWLSSLTGNDFDGIDVPAGNRFLNYLSCNYMADRFGAERGTYNPGNRPVAGGSGYKITENADRDGDGYYLSASNAAGLTEVFKQIQSETMVPSVELDEKTVISDKMSGYFNAPSADTVRVYTAPYLGEGVFGEKTEEKLTVSVSGKTVSVSGFNFNENFIYEAGDTAAAGGKKVIIEFTVTPDYNAVDENISSFGEPSPGAPYNVPTNEAAEILKDNEVVKTAPSGMVEMYTVVYKLLNGETESIHKTLLRMPGAQVLKLPQQSGYSDWTSEEITENEIDKQGCFEMPRKNVVFTASRDEEPVQPEEPKKPEQPDSLDDIMGLSPEVSVICTEKESEHTGVYMPEGTDIIYGPVTEIDGSYTCTLSLTSPQRFVDRFNETWAGHSYVEENSIPVVTAVYNHAEKVWTAQGDNSRFIVRVKCGEEPAPPENPDYPYYPQYYNVLWNNYDHVTLESDRYLWGEMPVYDGDVPVKPEDDRYTYEFIGWDREIARVTGDAVYTAQFRAVAKEQAEPEDPEQPDNPDRPEVPDKPEKPDKPDKPNGENTENLQEDEQNSDIPKTGDSQSPVLWIALMAVTAGMLGITLRAAGKRK